MSDEKQNSDFWSAYNALKNRVLTGAQQQKPVDAWAQYGETPWWMPSPEKTAEAAANGHHTPPAPAEGLQTEAVADPSAEAGTPEGGEPVQKALVEEAPADPAPEPVAEPTGLAKSLSALDAVLGDLAKALAGDEAQIPAEEPVEKALPAGQMKPGEAEQVARFEAAKQTGKKDVQQASLRTREWENRSRELKQMEGEIANLGVLPIGLGHPAEPHYKLALASYDKAKAAHDDHNTEAYAGHVEQASAHLHNATMAKRGHTSRIDMSKESGGGMVHMAKSHADLHLATQPAGLSDTSWMTNDPVTITPETMQKALGYLMGVNPTWEPKAAPTAESKPTDEA